MGTSRKSNPDVISFANQEQGPTPRRSVLKKIQSAAGAEFADGFIPVSWVRPVVNSIALPDHAQTSQGPVSLACEITFHVGKGNTAYWDAAFEASWPGIDFSGAGIRYKVTTRSFNGNIINTMNHKAELDADGRFTHPNVVTGDSYAGAIPNSVAITLSFQDRSHYGSARSNYRWDRPGTVLMIQDLTVTCQEDARSWSVDDSGLYPRIEGPNAPSGQINFELSQFAGGLNTVYVKTYNADGSSSSLGFQLCAPPSLYPNIYPIIVQFNGYFISRSGLRWRARCDLERMENFRVAVRDITFTPA